MDIFIRPESPRDHAAIHDVTKRAFAPMPFADGDEQYLIEKLREAGALVISLVAERDGVIVGHIAFSPAFAADASHGWFALGPIAVEPGLQRQGVGRKLIGAGIQMLRELEAAGCVLVGNPNYYSRFGFKPFPHLAPDDQPAEFFMILPLRISEPHVVVGFHSVFKS